MTPSPSPADTATVPRYAVYFAPAVASPWWHFGAGWLGRDEQRGEPLKQPAVPGFSAPELHALTAEPRTYGFHATLKAPFRLRPAVSEALLRDRLRALAARLPPLSLGRLEPQLLDDFVALVPVPRQPAVDTLAAHCVLALDDLRAPLTPEEQARRRPERLDPMARELLQRHGYPWVLGLFRFHMTLSGPVERRTGERLAAAAHGFVTALNKEVPPMLDRLCLFREDDRGAPFVRIDEVELRR